MVHQIDGFKLQWRGDVLYSGGNKRLIGIEADPTYPGMWRVRLPGGQLSDMVNRTRAKNAAEIIILAHEWWRRWQGPAARASRPARATSGRRATTSASPLVLMSVD